MSFRWVQSLSRWISPTLAAITERKPTSAPKTYDNWTRQQLIDRLRMLEGADNRPPRALAMRKERPFDISKYEQRHIALKIAYLGWNYLGFAAQGDREKVPTVEDRLFQALEQCKLIESAGTCAFSRCGRTDKGVSGLGQVVSLRVRSNTGAVAGTARELPYLEIINSQLPDDIRVLAWAPVAPTFNARFSCRSRTYKYFFPKGKLDIDKMRAAARYFIGEHDFRNFCKLDPSKNITNYARTILSLEIRQVTDVQAPVGMDSAFYEVELKGTAFLWHQVRCIMSILFLVGQGYESPQVIRDLLDIDKVASRPDYPMASELPLLLYDCEFEGLEWRYSSTQPTSLYLYQHWRQQWETQMTRMLLQHTFLAAINAFPLSDHETVGQHRVARSTIAPSLEKASVILAGGREIRTGRYKKLLERRRGDTDAVKKAKYNAKKKRKSIANATS